MWKLLRLNVKVFVFTFMYRKV